MNRRKLCPDCGSPCVMMEAFDRYACIRCNQWREEKCKCGPDDGCPYSGLHPERPFALAAPSGRFSLPVSPAAGEDIWCSCIVCGLPREGRGAVYEDHVGTPVEWVVRLRRDGASEWRGLHSGCWEANLRNQSPSVGREEGTGQKQMSIRLTETRGFRFLEFTDMTVDVVHVFRVSDDDLIDLVLQIAALGIGGIRAEPMVAQAAPPAKDYWSQESTAGKPKAFREHSDLRRITEDK